MASFAIGLSWFEIETVDVVTNSNARTCAFPFNSDQQFQGLHHKPAEESRQEAAQRCELKKIQGELVPGQSHQGSNKTIRDELLPKMGMGQVVAMCSRMGSRRGVQMTLQPPKNAVDGDGFQPGRQLTSMALFVKGLIESVGLVSTSAFIVLGAEGDQAIIEIATGQMASRKVIRSIRVTLESDGWEVPYVDGQYSNSEVWVTVPDISWLLALIGLVERGLGAHSRILHPLDDRGDFFPGWEVVLDSLSS